MFDFLCKWFGHSYDKIDRLMFAIMESAENRSELSRKLVCRRCGHAKELNPGKGEGSKQACPSTPTPLSHRSI